jgi:hypothetical protein
MHGAPSRLERCESHAVDESTLPLRPRKVEVGQARRSGEPAVRIGRTYEIHRLLFALMAAAC